MRQLALTSSQAFLLTTSKHLIKTNIASLWLLPVFSDNELTIESENNTLKVAGVKADKDESAERKFIHQGIAERNFERKFQLGDHVKYLVQI